MLTAFLFALLVHPVHETVAEIDWNEETGRLEVSLRLDALDEQWLAKRSSEQESGENGESDSQKNSSQASDGWPLAYIRQSFRIAEKPKDDANDATTYHWIGRKEEGLHVWWHFELQPNDGRQPTWLENRMLFDKDDQHTNRVVILDSTPHRSIVLDRQHPRSSLAETNDATETNAPTDR